MGINGTPLVERRESTFREEWVFRNMNTMDTVKTTQGIFEKYDEWELEILVGTGRIIESFRSIKSDLMPQIWSPWY